MYCFRPRPISYRRIDTIRKRGSGPIPRYPQKIQIFSKKSTHLASSGRTKQRPRRIEWRQGADQALIRSIAARADQYRISLPAGRIAAWEAPADRFVRGSDWKSDQHGSKARIVRCDPVRQQALIRALRIVRIGYRKSDQDRKARIRRWPSALRAVRASRHTIRSQASGTHSTW